MKLRSWGTAALAVCLVVAGAARLHAYHEVTADQPVDDVGARLEQGSDAELASYQQAPPLGSVGVGAGVIGGGGGGLGLCGGCPIQLVFGAEYIHAQATFSEALAFVERIPGVGDTFHQIDFDYESSYSVYGGIYVPDCGGSLILEYTQLNSNGDFSASASGFSQISAPFDINDNIQGFADVESQSFDVMFGKTIPLGCLQTCDCCDTCTDACAGGCNGGCGGCGCCWCPAWDITFFGGVRYAEVDWVSGAAAFDPLNNNAFVDSAFSSLDFEGGGPRIGLMGRRYIGRRGMFSVFARGDWSILFGEVDIETIERSAAAGGASVFTRTSNDITVPVTEIELGSSIHLGAHATISGGYFWAAWHDLGMSPTAQNIFSVSHYDDANILGWNGFFARAEVAF